MGCSKSVKLIQNVCFWLMFIAYDRWCDGLATLVPKTHGNRKAQYGTSYPTHLTRLEEKVKTLPYISHTLPILAWPSSYAPADCSHQLHVVCYCRAWNFTWHFDHTRSAPSTDIKTSLQLRSMGWNLANLAGTALIGPLPLWKCRPPVRVFCTI